MDLYDSLKKIPFDFKELNYQRIADPQFDIRNPCVLGEMYNDKLDCNKHDLTFLNTRQWKNFAWCFYKLPPGNWIPPHKDHFNNYMRFYKVKNKKQIMRSVVFLENWRPGHVFGLENKVFTNWTAGDCFTWDNETEHWGGNFGEETRYTLQLTGTDDSREI